MLHSGYKTIKHGSGLLNTDSSLFEHHQRELNIDQNHKNIIINLSERYFLLRSEYGNILFLYNMIFD